MGWTVLTGGMVGWEVGKVIGSASTDSNKLADRVASISGGPETMPLLQCWASLETQ